MISGLRGLGPSAGQSRSVLIRLDTLRLQMEPILNDHGYAMFVL